MTRILALILCVSMVSGCSESGNAERSPGQAAVRMGSLVCLDSAYAADSSGARFSAGCPMLVVEMGEEGRVGVLSPSHRKLVLPSGRLRKLGRAPFADSLIGATEAPVERMISPPANPGVLSPSSDYGLIIRRGTGGVDTLFPEDWPILTGDAATCAGWTACLDSLQQGPWNGFLKGPFLPPWRTFRAAAAEWRYDTGQVTRAGSDREFLFHIGTLAKPESKGMAGESWMFIHAVGEGGADVWIWSSGRGRPWTLQVPFMEQAEITEVESEDIDSDGIPDLLVQTTTHYGDGTFSTLYPLMGGSTGNRPKAGVVEISGVSGEPGGSEVEGAWWVSPPMILVARVQRANEPGGAESHDLRVDAYRFAEDGSFASTKARGFPGVLYAAPMPRSQAKAWVDSLKRSVPVEGPVGSLRPLPRLVDGEILWQPGAVAPDAETAESWSRRVETGRILFFESETGP